MKNLLNKLKDVLDNHPGSLSYTLGNVKDVVENQITLLHLSEKLGANVPEYSSASTGCVDMFDPFYLIEFGPHRQAQVSCPDCRQQPEDGWYLRISFPTGPYTLNSKYPTEAFKNMFQELKDFGAHYTDTANSSLYFKLGEAGAREVYQAYREIYNKYCKLGQVEVLSKEIARKERELQKLRETSEVTQGVRKIFK